MPKKFLQRISFSRVPLKQGKTESARGLTFHYSAIERFTNRDVAEEAVRACDVAAGEEVRIRRPNMEAGAAEVHACDVAAEAAEVRACGVEAAEVRKVLELPRLQTYLKSLTRLLALHSSARKKLRRRLPEQLSP